MHNKLFSVFKEAIKSVNPEILIKGNIEINKLTNRVKICDQWFDGNRNYHVIGFGKAVFAMAQAIHEVLTTRIKSGVLSVPNASYNKLGNIQIYPGGENNLPDKLSLAATDKILDLCYKVPETDIVIVLISGGGSSLLCKPVAGISLSEKLLTIKLLVAAGANIQELNTVRKTLSDVKGGRLGNILKDKTAISLILSDVIEDALDVIASGPTTANTSSPTLAMEIIQKYKLELKIPKHVLNFIKEPSAQVRDLDIRNCVIGSNVMALKSILKTEEMPNVRKLLLSCTIEGLVDAVAEAYMELVVAILELKSTGQVPLFLAKIRHWSRQNSSWSVSEAAFIEVIKTCQQDTDGILLVLGGETTVQLHGDGKGGRNQELSLMFSKLCHIAKGNRPDLFKSWDVMLLSGGTDGIDGPTDAAGALGSADIIEQGIKQKMYVDDYLDDNNSYAYFKTVANGKYHLITGHTGTNVMDIHLILLYSKKI